MAREYEYLGKKSGSIRGPSGTLYNLKPGKHLVVTYPIDSDFLDGHVYHSERCPEGFLKKVLTEVKENKPTVKKAKKKSEKTEKKE